MKGLDTLYEAMQKRTQKEAKYEKRNPIEQLTLGF